MGLRNRHIHHPKIQNGTERQSIHRLWLPVVMQGDVPMWSISIAARSSILQLKNKSANPTAMESCYMFHPLKVGDFPSCWLCCRACWPPWAVAGFRKAAASRRHRWWRRQREVQPGERLWSSRSSWWIVGRRCGSERFCTWDLYNALKPTKSTLGAESVLFGTHHGESCRKGTKLQVEPGKPGAEVSKKKNYKSKTEIAYRMCTGWPTTAMPKPRLLSERAFSVPWWWCGDLFWCGWLQGEMK